MGEWTTARVQDRLELAADVFARLPAVKPQGYFSAWPEYFHSFADKVGQEPEGRRPRPSPRAITEAEEALLWLRWLEPEDAKLVWARVTGTPWKHICHRFGVARSTAHRRWEYGLSVIVWRLNGRQPHLRRGRGFVVERAR
jgi:hypothetical protein